MQETYSIFRNLGYLAVMSNVISDALDNLGGKPLSDEQKRDRARQQDEKLSVVAPAANLGVICAPIVVLVILGAEQMYKLVGGDQHGSYYSGGTFSSSLFVDRSPLLTRSLLSLSLPTARRHPESVARCCVSCGDRTDVCGSLAHPCGIYKVRAVARSERKHPGATLTSGCA